MITYENDCVSCPPEMGCYGSACKLRRVMHKYCDACGADTDELYQYGRRQLCESCLLSRKTSKSEICTECGHIITDIVHNLNGFRYCEACILKITRIEVNDE